MFNPATRNSQILRCLEGGDLMLRIDLFLLVLIVIAYGLLCWWWDWLVYRQYKKHYDEWKLFAVHFEDFLKNVLGEIKGIQAKTTSTMDGQLESFLRLNRISHDLQQIKTRLHWEREREIKTFKKVKKVIKRK